MASDERDFSIPQDEDRQTHSYVDTVDEGSVLESCTENGNDRDEVKEVLKLAKKETARVRVWRLIVLVTLLITGAVLSTFTYKFLKDEQHEDFKDAVSADILNEKIQSISN